jgi:hypothetical protein
LSHASFIYWASVARKLDVTRFLLSGSLRESFFPAALILSFAQFQIFRKFAKIFETQGAPQLSMTPAANEPLASLTPAAYLPPVPTILAKKNSGGVFTPGVNDIHEKRLF